MKKLLSTLLTIAMLLLAFTSCGGSETPDNTQIRVGYMSGPTGMGLAKLIQDNGGTAGNEKYSFKQYENTNLAKADLLAGNIDVICLPTNEAAVYYNTTDDNSAVMAINTLNTLFLVTDSETTITSFDELEGKTVYTCKNGTPKVILEYILEKAGVNATISTTVNDTEILTPKDLGAQIVAGNVDIAVAPEPIVTSSMLQRKQAQKSEYSIDINLNTVWSEHSDTALTMGCLVGNSKFISEHKKLIDNFLSEYKASVEFIGNLENIETAANYVVESGIMAAVPAAKSALNNLKGAIAYIDGANMKNALVEFYKAIGVATPDDSFFYEK